MAPNDDRPSPLELPAAESAVLVVPLPVTLRALRQNAEDLDATPFLAQTWRVSW
jgi:hypothetical protein